MKLFLLIIGILIFRMLASRGKKQAANAKKTARTNSDRTPERPLQRPSMSRPPLTPSRLIANREPQPIEFRQIGEHELFVEDYPPTSWNLEEHSMTDSEHEGVSHFRKNIGMTATERTAEKAADALYESESYGSSEAVESEASKKRRAISASVLKQAIITKEILDKPRALRTIR